MAIASVNIADISKTRRFVRSFATRSLIPILLTEACVEAGRTYNAYKRGGFTEARERITEEFTSAVIWLSGVPVFDKIIDKFIGKGLLNLPGDGFSVGKDAARNPVSNYIHSNVFKGKTPEEVEMMLGKFRTGKLITSLALATAAVGIAVPKINQAITRHMKKNEAQKPTETVENNFVNNNPYNLNMQSFLSKDKQDIAFTGAINGAKLMNFVNTFETTPKYQLLTEDGGVLVGRTSNSRNKIEGAEIAFRDGSSCYFYMFNTPIMASMFNKMLGGSKIDPVMSEIVSRHLIDMLGDKKSMSVEEFKQAALGDEAMRYIKPELERILIANDGRIVLESPEDLNKFFPELKKEAIEAMSKLQPEMYIQNANGEYVPKRIITRGQIQDLLVGGKINSPELIEDIYKVQTTPDQIFKVGKAVYNDPVGYVKLQELEGTKEHTKSFVEDIIKKAQKEGKRISKEMIEQVNKKQFYKQAFSWGTSFAVSILFLSMIIPKTQYWITKQITGSNEFPGTAEYDKKKQEA